jgi:alpha-galactosidase/6-phospho-beta-glucosidase family protein
MLPIKIVAVGAGSDIFGLSTLATLTRSERLRGSRLALVDRNPEALGLVEQVARRINREWGAGMTITTHTHHADALPGADFVISAIEVTPREALWKSDYEIPLKYGVRQPYAENGGPGGFAHAARNIAPVLEIAHDMEKACPAAWFLNFTNPMQRICDAVARYSKIRVVGLCHQIGVGYAVVGKVLADELGIEVPPGFVDTHASLVTTPPRHKVKFQAEKLIDIQAAGLNHFTWMLGVCEKKSGRDLYPLFRERWAEFDPGFEPLTRRVFDAFGLFPIPGDEHLCEYLPWVSDPVTKPWDKYGISLYDWDAWARHRDEGRVELAKMGNGTKPIDFLRDVASEGVEELIGAIAGGGTLRWDAVNIPNRGCIANLPEGAIVEVPGLISGGGVAGEPVGALPEPIAELCRREITVSRLCVDAVVHGDRQAALQCLLLDPVTRDLDVARAVLDDYLETYREYLPTFG